MHRLLHFLKDEGKYYKKGGNIMNAFKLKQGLDVEKPGIINWFNVNGYALDDYKTGRVQIEDKQQFIKEQLHRFEKNENFVLFSNSIQDLDYSFIIIDNDDEHGSFQLFSDFSEVVAVFDNVLAKMS